MVKEKKTAKTESAIKSTINLKLEFIASKWGIVTCPQQIPVTKKGKVTTELLSCRLSRVVEVVVRAEEVATEVANRHEGTVRPAWGCSSTKWIISP